MPSSVRQSSDVKKDMRTRPFIGISLALMAIAGVHPRVLGHPGSGIAVDAQGRVFFTAGPMIVMIETNGAARTIVHDVKNEKFYQLHHIQRAPDGALLLSDNYSRVRRVAPEGVVSTLAGGANQTQLDAAGLALDAEGNILVVDHGGLIRKILPNGKVETWAGSRSGTSEDGPLLEAAFDRPTGIAVAPDGAVFVLEPHGPRVRKIFDGAVTTILKGLP